MYQILVDNYGRRIRKLRVSLTDQCNLRCHYCMPVDAEFLDKSTYLSCEEYVEIIAELVNFGLKEVRLTGGEPLLRNNFAQIVQGISQLKLKKIGLTTNGILLDKHLTTLRENNILDLNVSLDSVNPQNFEQITHGNYLNRILGNLELASIQGFRIKLNMVVMKGINDHEIFDLIEYARRWDMEIRFLEIMRIGYACQHQQNTFISAQELLTRIKQKYHLEPIQSPLDATAFRYVADCGTKIGFIASESKPFCGHCSRWRLSVDGTLRACLLKDEGLNIRHFSPMERQQVYQQLLGMKPYLRPPEVNHAMYQIGG
ncbi:Molybdenum cofactor biosynthesis protein MoaA [Synechocystis sp. PCC 6714]|nr:Molybdenum cofactor biosynthesis protein MoaA [Synechocystis sp. PCC 6714]